MLKTQAERLQFRNGTVSSPFSMLPFAGETLAYFLENFEFDTVLDIGSGSGAHSQIMADMGKVVTAVDYGTSVYFEGRESSYACLFGDYNSMEFDEQFDAVWASHILEHQLNPNIFLKKINRDLKEGGVLAVTVPPLKHQIVGGHVTLWNAGLLLYQLVMANFNCRNASIKSYGYNVSVVLKKEFIDLPSDLTYDQGDIKKLFKFLPNGTTEPFDGRIESLNWAVRQD
ncbi:class I SAM-dependent methyltransferase [Gilvimarinus algae]|uniref:Methyltransferase domain-containing protein n=1 Tax=Gilvimarinus algae TaxID=3058037 RepID=A0ABT8TH62_9GAMM|nr:methyltransferase domain-containing protein [Gilvimarinus sp. SDUM040014]MDO3383256.1 methyltransferase domain-containing protein [Gilvimarinus sp. SDUM040014]